MKDSDQLTMDESLEDTIDMMEASQLCMHPVHLHSFAHVNFLISGPLHTCAGCSMRLSSVVGYTSDCNSQVVRCQACWVYAHRKCAMSPTSSIPKCDVNSQQIQDRGRDADGGESEDEKKSGTEVKQQIVEPPTKDTAKGQDGEHVEPLLSSPRRPPPTMMQIKTEVTNVWTNDGPPSHWADKGGLVDLVDEKTEGKIDETKDDFPEDDQPMQISESTFAIMARAIQENVLVHFRGKQSADSESSTDDENDPDSGETASEAQSLLSDDYTENESPHYPQKNETPAEKRERLGLAQTKETSSLPQETQDALVHELKPNPPPAKPSLLKLASGTYKAAKTSSELRKKLGAASVVGGITGGLVGLAMAGPAGAVLGVKFGQTAGVLSVVVEGSVTVGVLVAGATAGSFTANKFQQKIEQRILAIGEDGSKRKVLLVRPHVWIDPAWEQICETAKREAPSVQPPSMMHSFISKSPAKEAEAAQKVRYQRDSDIVQTAEFELPTEQKVLLLVSRILNDKLSLPGHVYRALVVEYHKRADERKLEEVSNAIAELEANVWKDEQEEDTEKNEQCQLLIRARRLDTHAVIKHVTATLLEVRPGFAANPTITEMSATSVEGLVFAQLYHSVLEEILEETRVADEVLMNKISNFNNNSKDLDRDDISPRALNTLAQIPEAHSPVDKLRYCVTFLERVSDHFSSSNKKAASADSLLKMVCLHLVAANVPFMNAEVRFLEEFARDERLLRGKEGYALVTLQASMHFLNASNDFQTDIFLVDDDE